MRALLKWAPAYVLILTPAAATAQTDGYRQLTGVQIRQAFAGRLFTDEVHFNLRYQRNGHVQGRNMGRAARFRWRVVKDELCLDEGRDETCYAVWKRGPEVSLKLREPDVSLDGFLR